MRSSHASFGIYQGPLYPHVPHSMHQQQHTSLGSQPHVQPAAEDTEDTTLTLQQLGDRLYAAVRLELGSRGAKLRNNDETSEEQTSPHISERMLKLAPKITGMLLELFREEARAEQLAVGGSNANTSVSDHADAKTVFNSHSSEAAASDTVQTLSDEAVVDANRTEEHLLAKVDTRVSSLISNASVLQEAVDAAIIVLQEEDQA